MILKNIRIKKTFFFPGGWAGPSADGRMMRHARLDLTSCRCASPDLPRRPSIGISLCLCASWT